MKLAILGGGGFRVPLVHGALLTGRDVTELVLHDVDAGRLAAIERVLAEQAAGADDAPRVRTTTDLATALSDVDFVFSAIRVGGLRGRQLDEQVASAEGVLGQETAGAGGIAYGLRTVPVAVRLARTIGELAPRAWVINFTNPAGMVTEAMAAHLGGRVIGICDSPVGLCRRVALALGVDPATAWFDYAGLNHLGWLRAVRVGGEDVLPRLLADTAAVESFEEGKLFGADWLRALGALPNEYLHYYYFAREAAGSESRGALLLQQQRRFYEEPSLASWERTRLEREATYMAETREGERDDLEGGGYEKVALALMRALSGGERTTLILNVRNGSALPGLPSDAVVEVPCVVDANGARPVAAATLPDHALGLVTAVKAVERATIEAATTGSRAAALRAFALHPLVGSVPVARRLLERYLAAHPELSYLA
ncbi:6-phospho-beta-glucosidase [Amycolatopsis balhimycina DSM 5908]|uniref:6-phospho-beta-glucosidase n=1 Tax=Amycolatopsis balhimycina DSM 5908 TaxID=1081091 RepID=A0A428WSR3_AMYBA|nr:6-phospho-beta-glucosidase [Amycolatopsis balhimycina]RSM46105.1 6-phospho-beta-glucosidase [Amycolatopsis balhimycina DSM 5908]